MNDIIDEVFSRLCVEINPAAIKSAKDATEKGTDEEKSAANRALNEMAKKLISINLDYSDPTSVRYNSLRRKFYICRYAVAYGFEYAMMYDLVMRLKLSSESSNKGSIKVIDFGAGTQIGAWAMAYANNRLGNNLKLYYTSVDRENWETFFVNPRRINNRPWKNPDIDPIDGMFEDVELYLSDIAEYLKQYDGKSMDCDVLAFSKIINELPPKDENDKDNKFGEVLTALENIKFDKDEYYLVVSHSKTNIVESMKRLNSIIESINNNKKVVNSLLCAVI